MFCGYDARESHGFHVFAHSVIKRATQPVSIIPLTSCGLPVGSNAFTLSRFLVPSLCDYKGWAIFADASDMLMLGDVARLEALHDEAYALQVVKHPAYVSQHERKYIGTAMECEQTNYERKNWASLMVFNCAHPAWQGIDADYLGTAAKLEILQFRFLPNEDIGDLPASWNVLIDDGQSDADANLLHWTAGIPAFSHYHQARRSLDWFREFREMSGLDAA